MFTYVDSLSLSSGFNLNQKSKPPNEGLQNSEFKWLTTLIHTWIRVSLSLNRDYFLTKKSKPPLRREYRNPTSTRGTVVSDVVIRPTTPRTKTPCVMTTGVWHGQRTKFQSPRHVKVTPNQYTTEPTTHNNSVKVEDLDFCKSRIYKKR